MTPVPETPVQKKDCIVEDCNKAPKGFKTSRGLKNHMKKFHDVLLDALSPMAATAKILFDSGPETPSVQGNSKGQVNSPIVVSEGTLMFGKCPKQFSTRDNVKIHMDTKHDKANAAKSTDSSVLNDKGNTNNEVVVINDKVLNNDKDDEEDLVVFMEDIEDGTIAAQLEKMAVVNNIVQTFVETAFEKMNPSEVTSKPKCHECECKDENLFKLDELLAEKDAKIEEKSATIRGLMDTLRKNVKTRTIMQKKVDQTDKVKAKLVAHQKEIANLKVRLGTKEAFDENEVETVPQEANHDSTEEITLVNDLKKCKKCNFTATTMNVLGLHMENDHQYEFPCTVCNTKFPFKNQLKIHKREVHEEGSFSCFVCNQKYRTHKELKQHIQRKCKSPAGSI